MVLISVIEHNGSVVNVDSTLW